MPQERENPYPNMTLEEWAEVVATTPREIVSARAMMARNVTGVPKRGFLTGDNDGSPILQGLIEVTTAFYALLDNPEFAEQSNSFPEALDLIELLKDPRI